MENKEEHLKKVATVKKELDNDEDCVYFDASEVLEVSFENDKQMDDDQSCFVHSLAKVEVEPTRNTNSDFLNGWVIENGNYVNKISDIELKPKSKKQKNNASALSFTNTNISTDKPYKCAICGNCFTRKDHLRRHEQGHTGITPFSCEECGKCFNRKDRLTRHMLIHTNDVSYQCDICTKIFSRKDHMASHRRSHDQGRAFLCDYCNKTFTRKDHLLKHKKSHQNGVNLEQNGADIS